MTKRHDPESTGASLRRRLAAAHFYLILDPRAVDARPPERWLGQVIGGGVDIVQLRLKGASRSEIVAWTRRLEPICREFGVPCIGNDDPEAAVEGGAQGVHVGQGDADPAAARSIVGSDRLLGVSTHSLEQAREAERAGADYLGFGAMFDTRTKERPLVIGPAALDGLTHAVAVPCFPIGGITAGNAGQLVARGVRRAAVSSAIVTAPDPRKAAAELRAILTRDLPSSPE